MHESSSLSVDIKNLVKTIHKITVQWGKDKFSAMDRRDLCNHRCASQFSEVAGIFRADTQEAQRGRTVNPLQLCFEGSNPSPPTYWNMAQFGRALDLGSRGRRFESGYSSCGVEQR